MLDDYTDWAKTRIYAVTLLFIISITGIIYGVKIKDNLIGGIAFSVTLVSLLAIMYIYKDK